MQITCLEICRSDILSVLKNILFYFILQQFKKNCRRKRRGLDSKVTEKFFLTFSIKF